jgi:hypothetical protein
VVRFLALKGLKAMAIQAELEAGSGRGVQVVHCKEMAFALSARENHDV